MEQYEKEQKEIAELKAKVKAKELERKRRTVETTKASETEINEMLKRFELEQRELEVKVSKLQSELDTLNDSLKIVVSKRSAMLEMVGMKLSSTPTRELKYTFVFKGDTLTGTNNRDGFSVSAQVVGNELWYDEIRNAIYRNYGKRNEKQFVNAFMLEVKSEYGEKFPKAEQKPIRNASEITTEIAKN